MNEITFPDVASATAAIVGLNAAFAVGLGTWPTYERAYVVAEDLPTITLFEGLRGEATYAAFAGEIAAVYSALAEGQESLGSEFEAVWDANVDQLYES